MLFRQIFELMAMIACKKCKRSFDKEAHNGYCPFCGENNN